MLKDFLFTNNSCRFSSVYKDFTRFNKYSRILVSRMQANVIIIKVSNSNILIIIIE